MKSKKTTMLWKSMRAGMKSDHGSVDWQIGTWEKEKTAVACSTGFHASELIIDGMGYVNMEVLARVEVRGKSDIEEDKQCWSEMRIVDAWVWKKEDSVRLAIYAAELVIAIFEKEYPKDDRPRKAIDAAKKWLKLQTRAARAAAGAAAGDAARAAARAAGAAGAAAWAAARAAGAAARAAGAAGAAAWAAARAAGAAAGDAAGAAAGDAAWAAWAAGDAAGAAAGAAGDAARAAAFKEIKEKCNQFVLDAIPGLDRYRPDYASDAIDFLRDDEIFVFGSNAEGNHAGGAAQIAVELFGAIEGQGEGLQGQSYALPTMTGLRDMKAAVSRFLSFAQTTPDKYFYVTKIGTGIAGHTEDDVRALFPKNLPANVILPEGWC